MSDKKLDKLIEEYGNLCSVDRGSSYDILTKEQENKLNDSTDKAKQAIVDYVEQEGKAKIEKWQLEIAYKHGMMDSTKHIREVWEKYKDTALNQLAQMGIDKDEEDYITETWRAIKADLGEK